MTDSGTPPYPSKPHIGSDRVEGTAVHAIDGKKIGTVQRLIIEKVSGQVVYVVISFGSYFGIDEAAHTIPWGKLEYDQSLGGYRTGISESELREAPAFSRQVDSDWPDRDQEEELHAYYRIPPYWRAI
jgi:hypothetical protein